jgi:hypothetical protein
MWLILMLGFQNQPKWVVLYIVYVRYKDGDLRLSWGLYKKEVFLLFFSLLFSFQTFTDVSLKLLK